MEKWVCVVCGYIHEGDGPPPQCPKCFAMKIRFSRVIEEVSKLEEEYAVGIAGDVDPIFLEKLRDNFKGDCTEAGIYLAMSRIAEREGYPEVSEAYRRIAWEEAEHAAQFAEWLGEVVSDSTANNLKLRAAAEKGATNDKKDLAEFAKDLNYITIYYTINEMYKDDVRHSRISDGLYSRFFK